MAYAQLTATRVRDAAKSAMQDLEQEMAAGSPTGQNRADVVKLEWLAQLAAASVREDETHAYVTVTPEDFSLIAKRYGDAESADSDG